MKKIVNDVIAALKKLPSQEKKGQTFWDYLKSQLYSESTWDQKDLKVIEKEIDHCLNKLEKKDITTLWKDTDKGWEKFEAEKKVEIKEMKADLSDELMGQVMDRMDDNYSSRDTYFTQPEVPLYSGEAAKEKEEFSEDSEPAEIEDEDLNLDDEILDEDEFDDDETNF